MVDEWKARPDRPVEVPLLYLQLSEQVERLRQEPTWRTSGRNAITLSLGSGELIVLESTVAHEVEALEESACLLTLAGSAQG